MPEKRDSFRHGNLREAAIAHALTSLEKSPDEAISLRAVAAMAGVAHRAVAAQFGNKAGLEAAIAATGFEQLADAVAASQEARDFVKAYAGFAFSHPGLYNLLMRQSYAAFEGDPGLRAAANRMISVSIRVLAPDQADPVAARRRVMRQWMIVHGGLALHRSGVLRGRDDNAFVDELLAISGLADHRAEPPQSLWNEVRS